MPTPEIPVFYFSPPPPLKAAATKISPKQTQVSSEILALSFLEQLLQSFCMPNFMIIAIEKAIVWEDRLELELKTCGVKSLLEEFKHA